MKVLLADDHAMMRDGLRAVLERAGHEIVGEAASGREAISQAMRLHPAAVIMDISMPDLNGIDATRRLTAGLPDTRVIALSMHSDRRYVLAMFEAGAAAYLLKNSASQELIAALQAVGRGLRYVSPAIAGVVLDEITGQSVARPPTPSSANRLSTREREVLQLIAEGLASKQIGERLNIALPTVESHRRQIMDKLGLRSVAELTKYAIREGITALDP